MLPTHGRRDARGKSIVIREPVPLDHAKPSVAKLPEPVVRLILDFLHLLSPRTIQAVSLLSSSLYEQARYAQHKLVRINLDETGHVLDRLNLIERLAQLPAIRTLRIHSRKYSESEDEKNKVLSRLAAILPSMAGLCHMHWDVRCSGPPEIVGMLGQIAVRQTSVPIPEPILAALHHEARLHTFVLCSEKKESHLQARTFLSRLAGSQSLHALSIRVIFIDEQDCLQTMHALKKVLLSCPNLTRIPNVHVWYPQKPCNAYSPPDDGPYFGLGFSNGEKPPALEELGLSHYPWGWEGSPAYRGYPEKGYEWSYWAERFDWSRLVRLCPVPDFLALEMAPRLTNLKEVIIQGSEPGLPEFFDNLTSPLEVIELPSWSPDNKRNLEIMDRFGATLKQLAIHQSELSWRDKNFVTVTDATHLSKSLLHLEHLSLDMLRNEDSQEWPYGILSAIATFPRLRTVNLCFSLRAGAASVPSLTVSAARHLFGYLRDRNQSIERVTLYVGELSVHNDRKMPDLCWGSRNEVLFVCKMVYQGESPEAGGQLHVSCPHLSMEMNEQIRLLDQQADRKRPDLESLDGDGLRIWVALKGPLSEDEWKIWETAEQHRKKSVEKGMKWHKRLQRLTMSPFKHIRK